MIRSFLAIELSRDVKEKIKRLQEDLKSLNADVRWVNPENIHLTLKFFGNVEESSIELIIRAVVEPAHLISPFNVKIQKLGAFPNLKNPRVIWIGLLDGKGILIPFQKELEKGFERIGFKSEDRPFQPHLTLGRMRSNRGKDSLVKSLKIHSDEEFGELRVEKIMLFKSDLRPEGPIYTPLGEVKLGVSL